MSPLGVEILVVGAGVGGLMAAIECLRRGCSVRVLERSKSAVTSGDSFGIGPSATTAFRNFPMLQEETEKIRFNPLMKFCDHLGNCIKGPLDFTDILAGTSNREGKIIFRYSRPRLHAALLSQLERMGLQVEYDNEVVEYFEDTEKRVGGVVTKAGTRFEADLVVAADGLRSPSWQLVAGRPVPCRPSGDAIYRVAFPVEIAMKDPVLDQRFPLTAEGRSIIEVWTGPNYTFSVWRNQDEMTWALTRPDPGTAEESWGSKVSPSDVLKFTAKIPNWPEVADRLIKTTPEGRLVDWKLMWRDLDSRWTSPGGRVVQLGDAAHAFLPQSGSGGTQAIEDAVSLGTCIAMAAADGEAKDKIPEATRVHNLLRFERVSCLQAFGVQNKKKLQTDHSVKEEASISSLQNSKSSNSKEGRDSKGKFMHVGRWILMHDPENYATNHYHDALSHITNGTPFKNTNTPPGLVYRPWTVDGLLKAHENGEPTILDGDWD